jgi:tetratricopeptide (TPR) repeat protein
MHALAYLGIIFATVLALAGAANAQPGLSTAPDYDLIDSSDRVDENAQRRLDRLRGRALAAMQAKDFAAAEAAFAELMQAGGRLDLGANFLMGLAKIGLEKWDEAQPFLEAAIVDEPSRPEPRTRLGITYAKLSKMDAARQQRAALASLDAECKQTCADAKWIAEGLALLDKALESKEAATRISAAALAAVAPATGAAGEFDPAAYSLVTFSDTNELYDVLTQAGRCPPKKTAEPRQPCALILYRPTCDTSDGRAANFKPVFKVESRKSIWAIHDKQLQEIRVEDLYFDNVDVIGAKRATHISVALVGNAENRANCDQGLPCLKHLVTEDMFRMYGNMPDSVVKVIWGGGMEDPGTVRVR